MTINQSENSPISNKSNVIKFFLFSVEKSINVRIINFFITKKIDKF